MTKYLTSESLENLFSYHTSVYLHPDMYQFLDDGSYNEDMFFLIYTKLKRILLDLLSEDDKVIFLINKYPINSKKRVDKIMHKCIKHVNKIKLSEQTCSYIEYGVTKVVHQLKVETTCNNIKWKQLILSLINQDFPDRKPQFKIKNSFEMPEIYIISPTSDTMIHIYDDRGYDLYSHDKKRIEQLLK
ncbi:hypothetical protein BW731_02605 [Vagococcus martis]|uniref:DUF3885 domain-containing protein n=1 Tax=Vagococcus martis TaxID=1768210 RepID=A0A1V4DFA7_9ENTE|nr:DUF3885 domain-containing protein [Vagococcus martis]OPF87178.1 hypothetical protein BW731_02605 [Vagococcus martis]